MTEIRNFLNSLDGFWRAVIAAGVGGGVFAAIIAVGGDVYNQNALISSQERIERLNIGRSYLAEIQELDSSFRSSMAELAADNNPPLDSELVSSLLANLRLQDQQLTAILNTGTVGSSETIRSYQNSLLEMRDILRSSNDPGDLSRVWPIVGKMLEHLDSLSKSLLSNES